MTSSIVVDNYDDLISLRPAWDGLARQLRQPFSLSAWGLAWWRHRDLPASARLHVVAVYDDDALVGLVPAFLEDSRAKARRFRMIGGGSFFRLSPLVAPGHEARVAGALGRALTGDHSPPSFAFEGLESTSSWPACFAESWPAPAGVVHGRTVPAPTISLATGDYPAWLASKSRNFRLQTGKKQRRIERAGGRFRVAVGDDDVVRGVAKLSELHLERWNTRGGSGMLDAAATAMLTEAGRELHADGSFRLWTLEDEEACLAAALFARCGGESACWGSGFATDAAKLSPGIQVVLAGIRDAFELGDVRVDLGPGDEGYKLRLADRIDTLEWVIVAPRGRHLTLARVRQIHERASGFLHRSARSSGETR